MKQLSIFEENTLILNPIFNFISSQKPEQMDKEITDETEKVKYGKEFSLKKINEIGYKYYDEIKKKYEFVGNFKGFKHNERKSEKINGKCHTRNLYSANPYFEITINKHLVYERDVRAVILHELAHAIKGCQGHNQRWYEVAGEFERMFNVKNVANRTNNRRKSTDVALIKFKLTDECIAFQKNSIYKVKGKIHEATVSKKILDEYKTMQKNGLMEIVSITDLVYY